MSIKRNEKINVAVAISGGVDSAVAAWLLKKKGHQVSGLFMDLGIKNEEALVGAKNICAKLDIPLQIVRLAGKFKKEIIGYFLKSYADGLTPNPCIRCNQKIKFGEMLRLAEKSGADFLATGHYVRISNFEFRISNGRRKLFKAKDKTKDQSYFLYTLTQGQLRKVLFPLGGYLKEDVRKIADREGLPYLKKESQDVCFLNSGSAILPHNEFLKKNLKLKTGPIMFEGKRIGAHQGLPLYTIGQRRGIEIGGIGPFYVSGFDYKKNILHVVKEFNDLKLFGKELEANEINWIAGKAPVLPFKCKAVIRYRHQAVDCEVLKNKSGAGSVKVIFNKEQRAITPGQSIVFYKGREVLGGGVIII